MFNERLLKKALQLYAGQHVLDRVLKLGEEAFRFDRHHQNLTLMFVEPIIQLRPELPALTSQFRWTLIDAWSTAIAQAVEAHHGIVESFIGDAVFACWGIADNAAHEDEAAACALHIVAGLREIAAEYDLHGAAEIKPRIAIHTGRVSVGNQGCEDRMKYSIVGDAVNLVFRLSAMCETQFHTPIVITEATRSGLNNFKTKSLEEIRLKGQDEPLSLFTL